MIQRSFIQFFGEDIYKPALVFFGLLLASAFLIPLVAISISQAQVNRELRLEGLYQWQQESRVAELEARLAVESAKADRLSLQLEMERQDFEAAAEKGGAF